MDKPKFILIKEYNAKIVANIKFKELGSDVEQNLTYESKTNYATQIYPEGYICLSKLPDWAKDCVCDIESYEDMSHYGDFDYWCVEIDGVIYEVRQNFSGKPDWATHFTYYSK